MLVKILSIATILSSTQVYAQSTTEISLDGIDAKVSEYIKEHFSASYHGEFYATRRDLDSEDTSEHAIKDLKFMHNPTLVYKPSQNWQALASGEFKFSDQPADKAGADYPNSFYRALFTVTRKNILNEKDNGIQLDAGIGRRQFNTGAAQASGGDFALSSYGNNRVFTTVSKTLGKHITSLFLQFLNNDYKKATSGTWKNSLEVVPTINLQLTEKLSYLFNDDIIINAPKFNNTDRDYSVTHDMNVGVLTYQFNDKLNTYYQFKYAHNENFTKDFQSEDDSFTQYIGVGYSFNPKATVTLEAGSEVFHARDGRDTLSKKITYPDMALYVDLAI